MKLLIFGPGNVGKTSLLRTTMENHNFLMVENLAPTRGISRETYLFRGLVEITAWDCGGQLQYMNRYFGTQEELVFGDVDIAVYMLDAITVAPFVREEFDKFTASLLKYTPDIKRIYVFINKVDLPDTREKEVFDLLTKDLPSGIHSMCTFIETSVKLGSAQEHFIKIMDAIIEARIANMARASKLRDVMAALKSASGGADFILFNKTDGLVVTSTFGKFSAGSLEFISFQLSALESNIHEVYSSIVEMAGKKVSPLTLNSVMFESADFHVLAREVDDKAVLMALCKRDLESLQGTIQAMQEDNEAYGELIDALEFLA